ncbi:MAG: dihydropteroate synthase, partial [Acidithiobacillus sp.]|nr:dihydropteroate synthase [Acidithiobacillus sp.]
MGVLNITPDSFSDGGTYLSADAALVRAKRMWEEGADIIDIGAESTRPGAPAVTQEEELRRLLPVLEAVAAEVPLPISIDTSKAAVMRA